MNQAATKESEPEALTPKVLTPEEQRQAYITAASKNDGRKGLNANQVRLADGEVLTFKELTMYDHMVVQETSGLDTAVLARQDPLRYMSLMAWRSAVNGGFDMPFDDFTKRMNMAKYQEITAICTPLLGKGLPTQSEKVGD